MKPKVTTALSTVLLAAAPAFAGKAAVRNTYADNALAKYTDSLITAQTLLAAVNDLTANPSAEALEAARTAWLTRRVPHQQTQVYRLGIAIGDDWERKVNAWPPDKGLIDYVDTTYGGATDENEYAVPNVGANSALTLSGECVDASDITPAPHEADGVRSNVATGYHAIEFLMWGQDPKNHSAGAGNRPWTDYAMGDACTGGHCDRRADNLTAAPELLVSDLEWIVAQWQDSGDARTQLTADHVADVAAMRTGMGSLSYGETAAERIRLAVMLNDPEEEHSCCADNSHNDHFYNAVGIRNVYPGSYTSIDGTVVSGPSLASLVAEADPAVDAKLPAKLISAVLEMLEMKVAAVAGFAYDSMPAGGNAKGAALVMGGVHALVDQTRSIERAVAVPGFGRSAGRNTAFSLNVVGDRQVGRSTGQSFMNVALGAAVAATFGTFNASCSASPTWVEHYRRSSVPAASAARPRTSRSALNA